MSIISFQRAIAQEDGPGRVAALAEWVQSLVEHERDKPVLVGGGAVELYSGGAYRTSDLDFVGDLDAKAISQLEEVGFRRKGRHWVSEKHEVFIEFPGSALGEEETAAIIEVGEHSVLIIGLEELVVDRLAAWTFWNSEIDAVNAYLLLTANSDIDPGRLRQLAQSSKVIEALDALERYLNQLRGREPGSDALATWARDALKGNQ